jgi:hypothetical protein
VDFDQSPLQPVVMDIVQHGGNTPSVHLSALVYYSETEYVEPYRVISEDRLADFTKDFSDDSIRLYVLSLTVVNQCTKMHGGGIPSVLYNVHHHRLKG